MGCGNLDAIGWKVKAPEGDAKAANAERNARALLVFILIYNATVWVRLDRL